MVLKSVKTTVSEIEGLKHNKELQQIINDLDFKSMLALKEWDTIKISTPRQVDNVIEFVENLIYSAKTCSASDPDLGAANICLGMIQNDMQPPRLKELFNKLSVYYQFDSLDSHITPNIIETAEDPTTFLLSVLTKYANEINKEPTKFNIKGLYTKATGIVKNVVGIKRDVIDDFFAKMVLENQTQINFGVSLIKDASETDFSGLNK